MRKQSLIYFIKRLGDDVMKENKVIAEYAELEYLSHVQRNDCYKHRRIRNNNSAGYQTRKYTKSNPDNGTDYG